MTHGPLISHHVIDRNKNKFDTFYKSMRNTKFSWKSSHESWNERLILILSVSRVESWPRTIYSNRRIFHFSFIIIIFQIFPKNISHLLNFLIFLFSYIFLEFILLIFNFPGLLFELSVHNFFFYGFSQNQLFKDISLNCFMSFTDFYYALQHHLLFLF